MNAPDRNRPEDTRETPETFSYQGNSLPRFLRFLWTVLLIFALVYLILFMAPSLGEWGKKLL